MNERLKSILLLAGAAATGTVLPLAGVALAGHDVRPFLTFPPVSDRMIHAPFSPPVFAAGLLAALALVVALAAGFRRGRRRRPTDAGTSGPGGTWPWWGYAGLALGGVTWGLAWTRFPWFAPFQRYTFFPLWLAYVLTVNAWTHRRTSRCMLTHRPGYFLALFPVSAAFWWWFEYLNRYVQNWQYVGLGQLTPAQYAVEATLPFSTVLPAVMGTAELLASWPRAWQGFQGRPLPFARWPRVGGVVGLLLAGAGLAALGLVPDLLFPLVWVSPLILIAATHVLGRSRTIFDGLLAGDGRRVIRLALAALVCGFFWEMWNLRSLAKWVYAVPWVGAWKVFEMPVLGYLGYLPFGLLCAAVADEVERWVTPTPRPIDAGDRP